MTMAARQVIKRFIPLFDRVLIEKAPAAVATKAGIVIPESAQDRANHGTVLAVGEGSRTDTGDYIKPAVKVGDHVLLPEYGGAKVNFENKEYFIYRDVELLGKFDLETGQ